MAGRRARGFTLIEMLATMSVLAVLLAIASPGLASLASANTLSAAQNEFAAALMLARGEALRRGVAVGVAAASPASGAEFNNGWLVFVDANGNGQYDVGETIVRQQDKFAAIRMTTASGASVIAFSGRGFLAQPVTQSLSICRATTTYGGIFGSLGGSLSKGYRIRIEPVGLSDVAEITSCT